jgi:hypothetical protein
MWDYQDRSIAHPRHQSIIGVDPATGEYEQPWLDTETHEAWKKSGKPLNVFLATAPIFDRQSRDKKPSAEQGKAGIRGLDCRYLGFAPQCHGWNDLTQDGGSGSFVILWSGVWKLTTAATIPYYTGPYGKSRRGFGYVTIGANVDEFHKAATDTRALLKDLQERFEAFRNFSPLAIGIDKQVFAVLPELSKKSLRLAMRSHTISTRYLKEMEKGTVRLNLDGTPADPVTDENRQHATEQLRERFKKQADARKAAAEVAKAAEAAARAEQIRAEKLSQLTEKFGRK